VAPVLDTPATGLITNNTALELKWKSVPYGATFDLQIDDSSSFSPLPLKQEHLAISGLSHLIDPLAEGKVYWRVRARNVNGVASSWSSSRYFTVDIVAPLKPVLSAPINGSLPLGTPTFSWKASATASRYQFEYNNASNSDVFIYRSAELTTLTHKPPTMAATNPPTTFYWFVRAKDAAGNWSGWSDPFTVTIRPLIPTAPLLVIPPSAVVTSDTTPAFMWGSVLYGNTYQIQINTVATFLPPGQDSIGSAGVTFYIPTPLSNARYYWRVRAINLNGELGPWSTVRTITISH
jgi:hypothetical protein